MMLRTVQRTEQVAKLMAQGLSDKQIAERLGIGLSTAKRYVRQAYAAGAPKRTTSWGGL